MAVILMVRVPDRPSRLNTISIPSARSEVCARRSRPASARGLFGQPHRGPSSHSIAANIYADLQKVGCASRRVRSVCHELAHMGRYRVGVDDVLDRVAPRNSLFDQFNFQLFRHPKPDI
jgi:hypothetical protein